MSTFVLVPGAWMGAWVWKPVTQRLRAFGHEVYPLSLTGMGERVHLAAENRAPTSLLQVSRALREVGDLAAARKLAEESYEKDTDKDRKHQAAVQRGRALGLI